MELYNIVELAKLLKIPESTARYYRDRHPEYFHFTGKGRRKMYLPDTLEALRFICEQANNSRTAEQIEEALQARFNREINTDGVIVKTAVNTAEEQQLKLMNTLTDTLISISDQKKEIQSLRDELKEFRIF